MSRSALLILTANEAAIYPKRAASEGRLESLAHPTGSTLLGWAALAYESFKDPWAVFHSGRVRFSDALPLTAEGEPSYPVPKILMQPKHGSAAVNGQGCLSKVVRVGRPNGPAVQHEALKDGCFVTAGLRVVSPVFDARLRTATENGRAAVGQLFGYQFIRSGSGLRYAATIVADHDIAEGDWKLLLDQFRKPGLRLGRAKSSHGGAYDCVVHEGTDGALWPKGSASAGARRVRVWALSDLALLDEYGAPCLAPGPQLLGLPPGGRLDGRESAISVRRYSPWNRHLRCRDVDRQVIQAGSVLSYDYRDAPIATGCQGPGAVGLWQEAGLGRVWVAPPLLAGERPRASDVSSVASALNQNPASSHESMTDEPLVRWAEHLGQAADVTQRDTEIERLKTDFDRLHRSADRIGPSAAQWHEIAAAARFAPNLEGLRTVLFQGPSPVCGIAGQTTRTEDWGRSGRLHGEQRTFRAWLEQALLRPAFSTLPMKQLRWAVVQLAKHAADTMRGAGPR